MLVMMYWKVIYYICTNVGYWKQNAMGEDSLSKHAQVLSVCQGRRGSSEVPRSGRAWTLGVMSTSTMMLMETENVFK